MTKAFNFILIVILGYFILGIIFGKNGLIYSRDMDSKIEAQVKINNELSEQNILLEAKVNDLKNTNYSAYDSYLRRNLNYIFRDEVFFRVINSPVVPLFYNKDDINPFIPDPKAPILNVDLNKLKSR